METRYKKPWWVMFLVIMFGLNGANILFIIFVMSLTKTFAPWCYFGLISCISALVFKLIVDKYENAHLKDRLIDFFTLNKWAYCCSTKQLATFLNSTELRVRGTLEELVKEGKFTRRLTIENYYYNMSN